MMFANYRVMTEEHQAAFEAVMVEQVTPALAQIVQQAAADLAQRWDGDEADIYSRDDAARLIVESLGQWLGGFSAQSTDPLLHPSQLTPEHCRAWLASLDDDN